MPEVSVLMSVYNGEKYLIPAVRSILLQEDVDLELLIMDDGSTDNSWKLLNKLAEEDTRIRLFQQENQGLGSALNALFRQTESPFIARMDDDDVCLPWRLRTQLNYLKLNPKVGFVGAWWQNVLTIERPLSGFCYPDNNNWIVKQLLKGRNVFAHATVMMRKSVLDNIEGPYRFRFVQDYDLWLRLIQSTQCGIVQHLCHISRVTPTRVSSKNRLMRNRLHNYICELYSIRKRGEVEGDIKSTERKILNAYYPDEKISFFDNNYLKGLSALYSNQRKRARFYFGKVVENNESIAKRAQRWRYIASIPGGYRIINILLSIRNPLLLYQMSFEKAMTPEERRYIKDYWYQIHKTMDKL